MITDELFYVAIVFFVAIVLGLVLLPKILLISYKKRLFDVPDKRKVHKVPVPRLGGLSFFPAVLIAVCFGLGLCFYQGGTLYELRQAPHEYLFFLMGCMLLYIIGVADDIVGVGYRYKFFVQIITASLIAFTGDWINTFGGLLSIYGIPAWAGKPFTVLIIVYITNAINLIDGIDGLASGLSCVALSVLSVLFAVHREYEFMMIALATLGVLIPFWFYNVFGNAMRGHKLFMGDTGSLTLGYILSFLIVRLSNSGAAGHTTHDLVIAFSTLIVPLFDVVRVVISRLCDGKSPFLPDKRHIHHKLHRAGMRLRMILVAILLMALFFVVFNALLVSKINVTYLFSFDVMIWIAIQLAINCAIKRNEKY